MSENVKLSWSALGSIAHGIWRHLHRMMMLWVADLRSLCDGKHACSKFITPHLIFHIFLIMFIEWDGICAYDHVWVLVTLQMAVHLEPSWPGLHLYRHTDALSGPLMWYPWAPSSPMVEVEQQGAKEWWEARRAQGWSKGNSFTGAECDVVK